MWFFPSSFLPVPFRVLIPHVKFILNRILIEFPISLCMRLVSCAFSVWDLARWHNEWMIMIIVMTILQSFAFVSMERSERAAEKVVSSVKSCRSVHAVLRSALCHIQLPSIPASNISCLLMASSEKLFYSPCKFVDFYLSETPYFLFCFRTGHLLVGICFVFLC